MRRCLIAIVSGALAAPLTACNSSEAAPPTARSSSSHLVTYQRSGGIVGATLRLAVSHHGHVTAAPNGDDFQLNHKELARLKHAIKRADLADLPADNRSPQRVADGYQFTVSAQGHTVYAEDGAVPHRLQPLLSRLDRLLGRAGIR